MKKRMSGEKQLKLVATAQCDFAQLRENDDNVYVDKTDMPVKLASKEKDAICFIARPRLRRRLRRRELPFASEKDKPSVLRLRLRLFSPPQTRSEDRVCAPRHPGRLKIDPKIKNIAMPLFEPL